MKEGEFKINNSENSLVTNYFEKVIYFGQKNICQYAGVLENSFFLFFVYFNHNCRFSKFKYLRSKITKTTVLRN